MKRSKLRLVVTVVLAVAPLLVSAEGGLFDNLKKQLADTVNQTKEEVKKGVEGATDNVLGNRESGEPEPPPESHNRPGPTTITNPLETLKQSVMGTVESSQNEITGTKEQLKQSVNEATTLSTDPANRATPSAATRQITNPLEALKQSVTGTVENSTNEVTGINEPRRGRADTGSTRVEPRARERVPQEDVNRSSLAVIAPTAVVAAGGAAAAVSHATVGSPRGVDVVGLRLGMSPHEAKSALQAHDATLQPVEQYTQFFQPGMPKTNYLGGIGGGDIVVMFAPPPRASLVKEIRRLVKYPSGQQPTLDNTFRALKQKYGEPTIEEKREQQTVVVSFMFWLFDQGGQLIAASDTERAKQCSPVMATREALDTATCGISLSVQLLGDLTMGVASLNITLTDPLDNLRMAAETQAYIDNTIKTQAESVGAPKL